MQRATRIGTIRTAIAVSFTGTMVAMTSAAAQSAPAGTSKGLDLPPIRQLGAVSGTTTEKLGSVMAIRPLSDGRVLVNETSARRVLLFDASLKNFTVVADSTPATNNAYGGRFAGLVAWRGDSTLFIDPQSLSMLVLDPAGKVARVMSVPNAQDAASFASPLGNAGGDPQGRLVLPRVAAIRVPRWRAGCRGRPAAHAGHPGLGGDLPHRPRNAKDGYGGVHQDPEGQDEHVAG
jgi:hypothetical protein